MSECVEQNSENDRTSNFKRQIRIYNYNVDAIVSGKILSRKHIIPFNHTNNYF